MSSDKQRDLAPLLPKKDRGNFIILLSLLLIITASATALLKAGYSFQTSFELSILGDYINPSIYLSIIAVFVFLISLSLFLWILGIEKTNYRIPAASGCALLIIAQLSFISGKSYMPFGFIFLLLISALLPLIPAINACICQLGPKQSASR